MLERLYIKNFALIEELNIELCDKFNVLTGETGAGKSIIIDAVSLLLGGRAQTEFVRTGAEKALLEGVFLLPSDHVAFRVLEELGIDYEDDTLILLREISLNGRNTCRVNGRTLNLSNLRRLGLSLIDIHGQHDHQALLQSDKHLQILDQFGSGDHQKFLQEIAKSFKQWDADKQELEKLRSQEQEREQKIDFLQYQLTEIENANIKQGEYEELVQEAQILANAEKISNLLNCAYLFLFGGERGNSAYDLLSKALESLNGVRNLDSSLEKIAANLEPAQYIIEDTAGEVRNYLEEIEYSPYRLEEVESRLQLLKNLCKKYGPSLEDVVAFTQKAQAELEMWEDSTARSEKLEARVAEAWEAFAQGAAELTKRRKKLAQELEQKVTRELKDLAMPHAKFSVAFEKCDPSSKGRDKIELLISPNPGEPLLPVAKIASGGELSRIMLALKTILAGIDGIGTLIFDEIDSGIGGKAAQKVAEKLETISSHQQVICVTHSPLIASLADEHILLEKSVTSGRTRTKLRYLSYEERVDELTRMLGGEKQTSDLKRHALQMLKKTSSN